MQVCGWASFQAAIRSNKVLVVADLPRTMATFDRETKTPWATNSFQYRWLSHSKFVESTMIAVSRKLYKESDPTMTWKSCWAIWATHKFSSSVSD
jgi:hypothetical protein